MSGSFEGSFVSRKNLILNEVTLKGDTEMSLQYCLVFRPLLDMTELSSALKAGDDISAIKEICTGKIIPLEAMPELWKVCYIIDTLLSNIYGYIS